MRGRTHGLEAMLDDRDERPGVKFKDADLLGIPVRVTVGTPWVKEGVVEVRSRKTRQESRVPQDKVIDVFHAIRATESRNSRPPGGGGALPRPRYGAKFLKKWALPLFLVLPTSKGTVPMDDAVRTDQIEEVVTPVLRDHARTGRRRVRPLRPRGSCASSSDKPGVSGSGTVSG